MPTYDYRCQACGHEFENFQSIRQPALRKCPKCRKPKLERLIGSGAGILFKGGGFYQTDYRSESYKRGESSEKDGGKVASGSSDAPATTDAKPKADSGKSESAKPGKGSDKSSDGSPAKSPKKKSDSD